jgi:uncharacterized GH25 family protein
MPSVRSAFAALATAAFVAALATVAAFDAQRVTPIERPANALANPKRIVRGTVLRPDGTPAAGVEVKIAEVRAAFEGEKARMESETTRADGTFQRVVEDDRPRLVEAAAPAGLLAPGAVVATPGGPPVFLRLQAEVAIEVRVLDAIGKPVAKAKIKVTRSIPLRLASTTAGNVSADTDADGRARLSGIAPYVAHRLEIEPPNGRDDLWPMADLTWVPKSGEVRMEPKLMLRGRVIDAEGDPVPALDVRRDLDRPRVVDRDFEDALAAQTTTDAAGWFQFDDLHEGYVKIRLRSAPFRTPSRPADAASPVFTLRAGTLDAVLLFARPKGIRFVIEGWKANEKGTARLVPVDTPEGVISDEMQSEVVPPDGTVTFAFPRGDTVYTFWLPPNDDGRFALRPGVRAADSPIYVPLVRGRRLRGSVKRTIEVGDAIVVARMVEHPEIFLFERVSDRQEFDFAGLPEGQWLVTLRVGDSAETLVAKPGEVIQFTGEPSKEAPPPVPSMR